MFCLSQPPDDIVQINVYGATLAEMLNKGVNIHSFLSTNGYGDCVMFDVPRRDSRGLPPYLFSSLRDAPILRSLLGDTEDVKPVPSSPRQDDVRSPTTSPREAIIGDPLLNCSLSTIAGDACRISVPEDEDFDMNEMELIVAGEEEHVAAVREEQEEREKTPIPVAEPVFTDFRPHDSSDAIFPDTDDVTFGRSVFDCLFGVVDQVCSGTRGTRDAGGEELIGDVEGDRSQGGDVAGAPEVNNDIEEVIAEPESATPGFSGTGDLANLDAIPFSAMDTASPPDDDYDEFFDCSNDGDDSDIVMIADVQNQALNSDTPSGKVKKTSQRDERIKYTCQHCDEVLNWKPHYGKNRFLNHVRKHYERPNFKCKLCRFAADQEHKVRYHHRSAHPRVKYTPAERSEDEEDTKRLLELWHHCFPGFPAPIRLANPGRRPTTRRPSPNS